MLDTLRREDFLPHLGQPCELVSGDIVIAAEIRQILDKPLAQNPRAAADRRTPFSVLLRAAVDCPHGDGIYTLKLAASDAAPGVAIAGIFVSRVLNTDPEPASLFQAVFN